ncbi:baseplate assembly protein [Lysobacter sp. CA199]|uniref:baseplate assembly protein n=1 Tax=Lysobacter sp. CA199 TaxID=3455608 RepID=UPI003F8D24F0
MSTFTAVDLSRLPAPNLIDPLSFETIFSQALADLRARHPEFTATTEADPAYKIIQTFAWRELLVRQRVNEAAKAVMPAYALGGDLDNIAARNGVVRYILDPGDPSRGIPPTMESDTDFRRRMLLAPEGYSVAGPEGAYIFHALSAHADVRDASATSPSPGDVVVTVLSRRGDGTASAALVEAVARALTADDVRPLTDRVSVQSAQIVSYRVRATVYTYAGPDSTVVLAESMRRLNRYIEESHHLGRDVPRSGLFSVLHSEGVQRVELHEPATDLVINRAQASFCTEINVTAGGVDE